MGLMSFMPHVEIAVHQGLPNKRKMIGITAMRYECGMKGLTPEISGARSASAGLSC